MRHAANGLCQHLRNRQLPDLVAALSRLSAILASKLEGGGLSEPKAGRGGGDSAASAKERRVRAISVVAGQARATASSLLNFQVIF